MPEGHQIDVARRIVMSRGWGVLSAAELQAHYEAVATDPDFDPTFAQLVDLREVTNFAMDSDALRAKARNPIFRPGVRRAFVASSDLAFGISRMFASYAESASQTIAVFRSIEEAERWLGICTTSASSREQSSVQQSGG